MVDLNFKIITVIINNTVLILDPNFKMITVKINRLNEHTNSNFLVYRLLVINTQWQQ